MGCTRTSSAFSRSVRTCGAATTGVSMCHGRSVGRCCLASRYGRAHRFMKSAVLSTPLCCGTGSGCAGPLLGCGARAPSRTCECMYWRNWKSVGKKISAEPRGTK
eukprot:scaffold1517_cov397-Prasinococcus_capsulatus_cf.AAC.8